MIKIILGGYLHDEQPPPKMVFTLGETMDGITF
jgi:hypothetical protein